MTTKRTEVKKTVLSGEQWDLENPIIRSIDDHSSKDRRFPSDNDEGESLHPISVMVLAAGKLWCAIKDRIFVVCPNSLNVQVVSLLLRPSFVRLAFSIRSSSTIVIDTFRVWPPVARRCITFGLPLKVRMRFVSTTPHNFNVYSKRVFDRP